MKLLAPDVILPLQRSLAVGVEQPHVVVAPHGVVCGQLVTYRGRLAGARAADVPRARPGLLDQRLRVSSRLLPRTPLPTIVCPLPPQYAVYPHSMPGTRP